MEDYTLFLKSLLKKELKDIETEALSENLKKEFDKTAENMLLKEFYDEAIKTLALTKNYERLKTLGYELIKIRKLGHAYNCFKYANDKEGMNKVGEAYLSNAEVENAYSSFKFAENWEMRAFIEENFMK